VPTKRKASTIDEITDQLTRATLTIVTDYRGLTVTDLEGLRTSLRSHNAEFRVSKNTLTTIAAERAGIAGMDELLAGPTALVIAYDDPVQPSKVVTDFVRTSRIMTVRGGIMAQRVVSAPDINAMATLPPREELLGKLVGLLASPMARTVGVLNGPIRSLPYVLQARVGAMGGSDEIAAD
jgi:large subunit ribosomal protein L10